MAQKQLDRVAPELVGTTRSPSATADPCWRRQNRSWWRSFWAVLRVSQNDVLLALHIGALHLSAQKVLPVVQSLSRQRGRSPFCAANGLPPSSAVRVRLMPWCFFACVAPTVFAGFIICHLIYFGAVRMVLCRPFGMTWTTPARLHKQKKKRKKYVRRLLTTETQLGLHPMTSPSLTRSHKIDAFAARYFSSRVSVLSWTSVGGSYCSHANCTNSTLQHLSAPVRSTRQVFVFVASVQGGVPAVIPPVSHCSVSPTFTNASSGQSGASSATHCSHASSPVAQNAGPIALMYRSTGLQWGASHWRMQEPSPDRERYLADLEVSARSYP